MKSRISFRDNTGALLERDGPLVAQKRQPKPETSAGEVFRLVRPCW